jgi:hypothetical protein
MTKYLRIGLVLAALPLGTALAQQGDTRTDEQKQAQPGETNAPAPKDIPPPSETAKPSDTNPMNAPQPGDTNKPEQQPQQQQQAPDTNK